MTGMGFKNAVPAATTAKDAPELLISLLNNAIGALSNETVLYQNVERYQAVRLTLQFNANQGDYMAVQFTWDNADGSVPLDDDNFVINASPFLYTYIQVPVRGSRLTISVDNLTGSAQSYTAIVYGSYRPVTRVRYSEYSSAQMVLFSGQSSPGAGATSVHLLPAYSGQIVASIQPVGTAGQSIRTLLYLGRTSTAVLLDRTYVIGTTAPDYGLTFLAPREPLALEVRNLGASVINGIRSTIVASEP